ncbi:uncharacterized protein LOC111306424 [Durio zibethinus]|uniref:Uncharacterized protein LOC111306424 n=1 Tax=Durio zibethinus TaxID=66656 RepID=A0A6P6A5M8_DURZI|nr:uncharacterized protein LOC111306424 [Durio zibethinus]
MAAGVEDIEVGFKEANSCLPSHVLDDQAIWETKKKKDDVKHNYHRHRSKLPTEPFPPHSKGSSGRHQKPRYSGNWASGGGMQAIFLDSGKKSCGTGVFHPQTVGTNFQSSRKPACSPVLLPFRVVQALNLNVHELGRQISPRRDLKNNSTRSGDKGKDVSTKRWVISQNENSSPEIFLPEEWTY